MKRDDFAEFSAVLSKTWILYDKPINADLTAAMFEALQDYELEDIKQAIKAHISNTATGQYTPKVSDIIGRLEGTEDARASAAWALVLEKVQDYGYTNAPTFRDPIISNAISNMGGWRRLCDMSWDDEPFLAKRFEEIYKNHIGKNLEPKALRGEFDRTAITNDKRELGLDEITANIAKRLTNG